MHGHLTSLCVPIASTLLAAGLCSSPASAAPFKVYSPVVHSGEKAVEYSGYRDFDHRDGVDSSQTHKFAFEYGVNDVWATEVEVEFQKEGRGVLRDSAVAWENRFQLNPQGRDWATVGVFVEYEFHTQSGGADEVKLGPLLEWELNQKLSATLNLFLERQIGSSAESGTVLAYGARLKYSANRVFEPALELFGEPGKIGHFPSRREQEHWIGPAVYGALSHHVKYRAALLFGTTEAASDKRAVLQLEYEL